MTDQEIFEKLSILLKEIYGLDDIQEETYLDPFDVLSEDNDLFFGAFENEFGVDLTTFDYYKFFYEDQFILMNLLRGFLHFLKLDKPKKIKITVGHLVEVVKNKEWFDPQYK